MGKQKEKAEEAVADSILWKCTMPALEQAGASGFANCMVPAVVEIYAKRVAGGRDA